EQTEQKIQGRECARRKERCTRPKLAQKSAHGRTEDEAQSERRADDTEGVRPLFRRRDVGNESVCRNVNGPSYSCHGATEKKPADRGRKSHQRVVETKC